MSLLTDFQTVQAKIVRANDWCNFIFQHKPPYTELKYIQANGRQQINLNIHTNNNSKIDIKYQPDTSSGRWLWLVW